MRALLLLVLATLAGCEEPPAAVRDLAEVDGYLARGQYRSACVGLRAQDAELRRATAGRLASYAGASAATDCLCAAVYDPATGSADVEVLRGLAGTKRGELAKCGLPALTDARVQDRADLGEALGAVGSDAVCEGLAQVVDGGGDAAARAGALRGMAGACDVGARALALLQGDPDPAIRAAAAGALATRADDAVKEALFLAASADADGGVRAMAFGSVWKGRDPRAEELACKHLMGDPDERVREAAARALHGTKSLRALRCLEERLGAAEPSPAVRRATMDAVRASPEPLAADVLCRSIGPFLRANVVDAIAEYTEAVDIIDVHNDRDFQRSYECVEKALRQGNYSCYARNHLGRRFREFGGQAPTPWCPGMVKNAPSGEGGGGELEMGGAEVR